MVARDSTTDGLSLIVALILSIQFSGNAVSKTLQAHEILGILISGKPV